MSLLGRRHFLQLSQGAAAFAGIAAKSSWAQQTQGSLVAKLRASAPITAIAWSRSDRYIVVTNDTGKSLDVFDTKNWKKKTLHFDSYFDRDQFVLLNNRDVVVTVHAKLAANVGTPAFFSTDLETGSTKANTGSFNLTPPSRLVKIKGLGISPDDMSIALSVLTSSAANTIESGFLVGGLADLSLTYLPSLSGHLWGSPVFLSRTQYCCAHQKFGTERPLRNYGLTLRDINVPNTERLLSLSSLPSIIIRGLGAADLFIAYRPDSLNRLNGDVVKATMFYVVEQRENFTLAHEIGEILAACWRPSTALGTKREVITVSGRQDWQPGVDYALVDLIDGRLKLLHRTARIPRGRGVSVSPDGRYAALGIDDSVHIVALV